MKIANKTIGLILAFQIITTLALAAYFISTNAPGRDSVLIGSAASLINFILLTAIWSLVFSRSKKNVALAILFIVIKYSILIWVFAQLPRLISLHPLGFAVGLLLNPLAVIVVGLNYKLIAKK